MKKSSEKIITLLYPCGDFFTPGYSYVNTYKPCLIMTIWTDGAVGDFMDLSGMNSTDR